jgi:glycosyltransferase involved in cell wall biosynthesis
MGFASAYLEERTLFPQLIEEEPDKGTGIIVVVPAYNERGLIQLLDSLSHSREPVCKAEVIIIINAPDDASQESVENNLQAFKDIESWKKQNTQCFFRLYSFIVPVHSISGWGVGLARKTGMDEAVRRFDKINKPHGVILNLDADCTVEKNYFVAVSEGLAEIPGHKACSIYFEHPLSGSDYPENTFRNIALYELHLRYYYQALAYTQFPYVFHTVGSSLAVKALPYIKAGGMNRRQAGEDFYFIQKLVPSGGYFNLNTTIVHPSPRISDRVPFGTGASMGKLSNEEKSELLTYNLDAFTELKSFFSLTGKIYESAEDDLQKLYPAIPESIQKFLDEKEWIEKMTEVKNNTSNLQSFKKRFFDWFNMFKVVKYLNFAHSECFEKKPVEIAAAELLSEMSSEFRSVDPVELLWHFRNIEKGNIFNGI